MNTSKTFNIKFPFEESKLGHFFNMTVNSNEAAVSNFKFFLTLKKGDLLYKNNVGLNLEQYLFEPIEETLINDIKKDITEKTLLYFPYLKIKKINIIKNDESFMVGINIELTIYGEAFSESITFG